MSWEATRELISAGAIVASIIFVAVELQQNTSVTRV